MLANCPTCGLATTHRVGGLCPDCLSRISVFAPAESDPAKNPQVGDYELIDEIAHGGMGVVFKARQRSLDRLVALKLIRAGQFASEADLKRFQAEAHAAAHLDHPNIMPIYEVGTADGRAFFSMKLLPRGSLRSAGVSGSGTLRRSAQIVVKVAKAVQFAHQRGILHRDLKPENILLDERGEPHVTDFGLAKRMAEEETLTLPGAILGTPAYMAPEQAEGKSRDITTAADIYSLGAVLYFLISGHAPFEAESALATMHQVLKSDPSPPSQANPEIDRDLETICLKCLEKNPLKRYRAAEELADDLERWLRGEPIHARAVAPSEKLLKWVQRHPVPAILLVLLCLACVLGISGILWQWRRANREANIARKALEQARSSLWKADLEQAHSVKLTGEAGRREKALQALREAAKIRPSPELRTEAIAALSLIDLGSEQAFLSHPAGGERAQRDLFLPTINHDLTVAAWPLNDQSFLFRDFSSGLERGRLPPVPGKIKGSVWSANDRYFAVLFSGGVQIWDLPRTNMVFQLRDSVIRSLAFSHDSEVVAIADDAGIKIIRLSDGMEQLLARLGSYVSFNPAKDWLAIAEKRNVAIWNYEKKEIVREFVAESDIESIYWSRDGHVSLCVQSDKNLFGCDVFTGDKNIYEGHIAIPGNVTFGERSAVFASSTPDGNTRLWDTLGGYELMSTVGGAALRFSSDGKRLAFVRPDRVGVWSVVSSANAYSRLFGRMDFDLGNYMTFSPDTRWAFSVSDVVPGLWAWNLTTRALVPEPLLGEEKIYWIGFAGDRIVIRGAAGLVTYRVSFDGEIPVLSDARNITGPIRGWFGGGPSISKDGRELFVVTSSTGGRIFSVEETQELPPLKADRDITTAAFDPAGKLLAAGFYGEGGTALFSLADFQPVRRLGGLPAEVAFSPDGRWLANFTAVSCEIWDTREWNKIKDMPRREADVDPGRMTFAPDGHWFAYVNSSHSCTLLETESWREIATFELPKGTGASRVAFSPNQEYLCLFGKAALHLYHLPSLRHELNELGLDW